MRTLSYFVSDVHLGLASADPKEREQRFTGFLKSIPRDAEALYLLGDIWDFWYEYRDVVPREGIRVVAEFIALMDAGVKVYFFPGNHDIWCYSFFESLGMQRCRQPMVFELGGRVFCLGHGDGLGGARPGYRLLNAIFKCRPLQKLFSTLHPWIAFRLGAGWSKNNRKSHGAYHFRGEDEVLYRFAIQQSERQHIDFCIFGHYHDAVDMPLPTGTRLIVLKDWISGGLPHAVFDSANGSLEVFQP